MKRLLLSLSLAGAAVYAVNPLITTQDAVAVQTHPTHPGVRHLRSWGSYLSSLPLSQKPQTPMATYQKPAPLPPQQNAAYGPRPNKESPGQNPERTPGADDRPTTSASGIDGSEPEPVEWAKVMLAARVHSEASVSSPTVRYYRPGTELQVVRREDGWVGVSDPVTQERGWVFEKYLSSIDGPSPTQAAMVSTNESEFSKPTPAKPALPNSKKRSPPTTPTLRVSEATPVSDDVAVTQSDPRSGRWAGRGDRRRGGLFMFGPLVRF
jgi:Bacterial SH3 domain